MTVASDLNSYKEITAKLVAGRLFLFIMDISDVIQESDNCAQQEKKFFPRYIHSITSPHCFEGRKRNVSLPSNRGKQPPPFWCPPGAISRAMDILPHFVENVNMFCRTNVAHTPPTRAAFLFQRRFSPKHQCEKGHLQGGFSRLFSLSKKTYLQSKFQSKSRCL